MELFPSLKKDASTTIFTHKKMTLIYWVLGKLNSVDFKWELVTSFKYKLKYLKFK